MALFETIPHITNIVPTDLVNKNSFIACINVNCVHNAMQLLVDQHEIKCTVHMPRNQFLF